MKEITISVEEYNFLQEARVVAEAFANLLSDKLVQERGIYPNELAVLCTMYGIKGEEA